MSKSNLPVLIPFLLLILGLILTQSWITVENQRRVDEAIQYISSLQSGQISEEQQRQELLALSINNAENALMIQSVISNLGAGIGLIVALSGAVLGIIQYFGMRQKEQADRLAEELNQLWADLAASESANRARVIAGLQRFLGPEHREFHERVASALALAGRMQNKTIFNTDDDSLIEQQTLKPVIERAMQEIPSTMRRVSWQGLCLNYPNLAGLILDGIDFRDCVLIGADFRNAKLRNSRFDAGILIAANFDGADLTGASLEYADLANASLRGAILTNANINNIKLLDSDWYNAHLLDAHFSLPHMDWRLAKNWRSAEFSPSVMKTLLNRYGRQAGRPCILMLLWEFYPVVAGGGWTAAYHLLRNLRRRDIQVIVVVPWASSELSRTIFGNEIEVIAVGQEATGSLGSTYSYNPFGSAGKNTKSSKTTRQNRNSRVTPFSSYSSYSTYSRNLLEQIQEFATAVLEFVEEHRIDFDIIHAHDWPTFTAAELLKRASGKPWIAHFHSTEADRQPQPSYAIRSIEARACQQADGLMTPSHVTQERLQSLYGAGANISVVPNCLSFDRAISIPLGNFYTKKIIFVGRISWQKGPDRFIEIARQIHNHYADSRFVVIGEGNMREDLVPYDTLVDPPIVMPPRKEQDEMFPIHFKKILPIEWVDGEIASWGKVIEPTKPARVPTKPAAMPFTRTSMQASSAESTQSEATEPTEPTQKSQHEQLEEQIIKAGFTAFAFSGDEPFDDYTHRIIVNETQHITHRDFIVETQDVRKLQVRHIHFVDFEPAVDWLNRYSVFEGASIIIVPSRHEPFGMIVLEAMEAGVPVLYPSTAGVNEQIKAGIQIDPENTQAVADQAIRLLNDEGEWQRVVDEQLREISKYPSRGFEELVIRDVTALCGTSPSKR